MILLKFISPSKNFHSQSKTTSFGRPDTKIDFWPEPELGPIKSLQIPLKELLNSDEPDQCFCSNRNFRSLSRCKNRLPTGIIQSSNRCEPKHVRRHWMTINFQIYPHLGYFRTRVVELSVYKVVDSLTQYKLAHFIRKKFYV